VLWSADQLESVAIMENIGEHLDLFVDEDDYAKWVQFFDGFFELFLPAGVVAPTDGGVPAADGGGGTGNDPAVTPERPLGGMHIGFHAQWTVAGSPSLLVDNGSNVKNFAFWRLHGWIDEMWERYRQARGLSEDDPEYQRQLIEQCEEMHELSHVPAPGETAGPFDAGGETGVFATEVAPILHNYCSGSQCHGATSPTLGLTLAGALPSVVRAGLVGRQSAEVSLALVEPGRPEDSWLYRKLTGNFEGIDCSAGICTPMPPAGLAPNGDEVERIRAWIAAGAAAE
jgi:hypothetical protein